MVAEGIERQEELDFLRNHDVDYVQGFLLGRPGPAPFDAKMS
ncbi:EAL domain-containing protein [Thalassospira sp.]